METTQAACVDATLVYTLRTSEKPVAASLGPLGHVEYTAGQYESRAVRILDGRPSRDEFKLDREGFCFVDHPTAVADFFDPDELKTVCYPESEAVVRKLTGAIRTFVFDHTLRTGDEIAQRERRLREPVKVVHNDYTDWSGPQRLRDLCPDEAPDLLRRRFAIIQLWRAIRKPVARDPLAICDARTLASDDLIPAERRHPNRVGEIYQIAYNPAHRWLYFPDMRRDEALVFKTYDSVTDGRARFSAHGSFTDPSSPADAPPRESIEIRVLAFFDS